MWFVEDGMLFNGCLRVPGGPNAAKAADALNFESDPFFECYRLGVPYTSMLAIFRLKPGAYTKKLRELGLIKHFSEPWTQMEIDTLTRLAGKESWASISRKLARDQKQVDRKAKKLGLKR